eukprot:gene2423-2992_t
MKLLLSILLLATTVLSIVSSTALDFDAPVLDDHLVNRINSIPKLSWKAKKHNKFSKMTIGQVMSLLGTDKPFGTPEDVPLFVSLHSKNIPDSFDSRTAFPGCVHEIRDQGQCGSCWAFAASEVLSDRFCIATNGKVNVTLSPQSLVSCDTRMNQGCNGGYPDAAWQYLEETGIPVDSCVPYVSGSTGSEPPCQKKCSDKSKMTLYKAKTGSTVDLNSETAIQQSILNNGPVEGTFMVYQDFMGYTSGVYSRTPGSPLLGGHAIKIVGWGHDDASGKNYWIVANSWGTSWGIDGYFYISRGNNECGIDRDASAAEAGSVGKVKFF